MVNTNKIKGRMAELGITQKDMAQSLSLAMPTISQKINNKRPMTLDEADKVADKLNIPDSDYATYFFVK